MNYKIQRKCTHIIRILYKIISDPKSLGYVLDNEEVCHKKIIKKYGYEKGLPTLELLDLVPDFVETVSPISFLSDGSTPLDYVLLKSLARKKNHCRYLEIGTWRGESIANVAQYAEECYSISLSKEELLNEGYSEEMLKTMGFFSKNFKNIVYIGANSITFNFDGFNKKFDVIFIDGDHREDAIISDTRNAFKLLKDENSVIIWHDYGFTPERIRWETLAGIIEGCPPQYLNNIYHVSNTLCAIFIRGSFETKTINFPQVPNKLFTIKISVQKLNE